MADIRPYMQDEAARGFFARLETGAFQSTYCPACDLLTYPPRIVCPTCLSPELEWKDLPRRGELLAFTWQEQAIRCAKPDVVGVVRLEGVGNLFTRIDADFEELEVGQEVVYGGTFESHDGLVLHQFR